MRTATGWCRWRGQRGRRARRGSAWPRSTRRWRCARRATPGTCCPGWPARAPTSPPRSRPTSRSPRPRPSSSRRSSRRHRRGPRCSSRSTPGCPATVHAASSGPRWSLLLRAAQAAGRVDVTGVWSHFACADQPDHPANDRAGGGVPQRRRRARRRGPRAGPAAPQQLGGHADPAVGPLRPGARRHRRVRHPSRSRPGLPDPADPGHDVAGPARAGQAAACRCERVVRAHLDD